MAGFLGDRECRADIGSPEIFALEGAVDVMAESFRHDDLAMTANRDVSVDGAEAYLLGGGGDCLCEGALCR
ncbi:hypothetical protein, partial [Serratia marcescens]